MPDVGKDLQLAYEEGFHAGYNQVLSELNSNKLKTIVRCKDCKNSGLDSSGINGYWCSAHTEWHDENWFCADGERRENE